MGIFKPKIRNETRLNDGLQEEIEGKRDNLNLSIQLFETAKPLIKKYAIKFRRATFNWEGSISVYLKEDETIDPEIYCDAGKIGLKVIPESGYISCNCEVIKYPFSNFSIHLY